MCQPGPIALSPNFPHPFERSALPQGKNASLHIVLPVHFTFTPVLLPGSFTYLPSYIAKHYACVFVFLRFGSNLYGSLNTSPAVPEFNQSLFLFISKLKEFCVPDYKDNLKLSYRLL